MTRHNYWYFRLGFLVALIFSQGVNGGDRALAQIVPDNTLNTEGSRIVRDVLIRGSRGDRIEGGAASGVNLFHSFQEFNVGDGERVYFENPGAIENIFSRVTGNNISHILGTLGVDGNANLYLLNPNGILFGPNARLDIRGSFLATTAARFIFPNGEFFSAVDPQAPPLLTVNVPIGLQYGATPGNLVNRGILQVGQDLTLAANTLDLQGQLWAGGNLSLFAQDTLLIRDTALEPFVAAAGQELILQSNQTIDIFALNHPDSGIASGGDLLLRSPNPILGDARYWSGGNFRLEQLDGTPGDLLSPNDPVIRSQGDVGPFNYFGSSLHILAGGQVTLGNVDINGVDTIADTINPTATPALANFLLSDGTPMTINGNASATLDIRAGMAPEAIGTPLGTIGAAFLGDLFYNDFFALLPNPTNNPVASSADITIGYVSVNVPDGTVFISNQFQPNLSLPGGTIRIPGGNFSGVQVSIATASLSGNGGEIVLDSRGAIAADGIISSFSNAGNAGDIRLLAQDELTIEAIDASSSSLGGTLHLLSREGDIVTGNLNVSSTALLGGSIQIDAGGDFLPLDGSLIRSDSVGTNPASTGGTIDISASNIRLNNGTRILSIARGMARSGDISINASTSLLLVGDTAISRITTQTEGTGNSGDLTISTALLRVEDGSQIDVASFGAGRGGSLFIQANQVELIGTVSTGDLASGIFANATGTTPNAGDGGTLRIETDRLFIRGGAQLGAGSFFGGGDGGRLEIEATDLVEVSGRGPVRPSGTLGEPSAIFTASTQGSTGRGGDLSIQTDRLILSEDGVISAETGGAGEGGDIAIAARQVSLTGGARIDAVTSGRGNAGSLEIEATAGIELRGISLQDGSLSSISVSTTTSTSGESATGDAGNLRIQTPRLTLLEGAQIDASTFSLGDGGNLSINAEVIELIGISPDARVASNLGVSTTGSGNAGELFISTDRLILRDGAQIGAGTFGSGDGGLLTIQARQEVGIFGVSSRATSAIFTSASRDATGRAGTLQIDTGNLTIQDGARVAAETASSSDGGDITITASQVLLAGTSPTGRGSLLATAAIEGSSGDAGTLRITTDELQVEAGGGVTAETEGSGDAGRLLITANRSVQLSGQGSRLTTATLDTTAGNLEIRTPRLAIAEGASITAAAQGGTGGSILLQVQEQLQLDQRASISASTAGGQGGSILIQGDRGTTVEAVSLSRRSQITATARGAGSAGDIEIIADDLRLSRSEITVSGTGSSTAGDLSLRARTVELEDGAAIAAETITGSGGNVTLRGADFLRLSDRSSLSASTRGGRAGNLSLLMNPGGVIEITAGSRVAAEGIRRRATATGETPIAGNLTIRGDRLIVQDNSEVTVSAPTGQAGSLSITARTILLNNGRIVAETGFSPENGQGANIQLRGLDRLLMANGSLISARALENADGGNILIDAADGFIIAAPFENNDMIATAERGTGGNINVRAIRLFGFSDLTAERLSFEQLRNNETSDISASSEFGAQGVITFEILNVDPSQGLRDFQKINHPKSMR